MSGSSTLKKITTRAKQIYKKSGTWKAAIKKAGAEYRSGKKVSGVKRKKAAPKKRRRVGATLSAGASGGIMGKRHRRVSGVASAFAAAAMGHLTAAQHTAKAKAQYLEQIGWMEATQFAAKTKTAKRKIGKKIAEVKSKYRKLC